MASSSPKTVDFFTDDPLPRVTISSDQLRYCYEALCLLKEKTRQKLRQEFDHLQATRIKMIVMMKSCEVAVEDANLNKNRYKNVLPFDKNRVVINSSGDSISSGTGYINASFITTSSSESVSPLIATQGPLPSTFEDFWEMIIQNRCPVIVMLTRFVDNYKQEKCGDYFQAEDGPREFANICIVTKCVRTSETSLMLHNLEVNYKESEEPPLSVLHIQYLEWPDQGVPGDTHAVRKIVRRMYHVPPSLGPIVVHCSAGIGRTGTFCAIYNTIQRILVGDMTALDLANTITIFRSQRIGMVETLEQFLFCHDAIVDELEDLVSQSSNHLCEISKCQTLAEGNSVNKQVISSEGE